ncbi:MAG: hypothetical protein HQ541_12155, partial [Mariniphaga sp.]|nr:hypothetical protein [Mariniphaga sp.]
MKLKVNKFIFYISVVVGMGVFSCTDLAVENLNEPDDLSKVLSNSESLYNYAGNAFRTLHNSMQEFDSPALVMNSMADQTTCSWGTGGQYDLSSEPRKGFTNSLKYPYLPFIRVLWEDCYESISNVNGILRLIEEKNIESFEDDLDVKMLQAWSYFVSGVAHGYLGLIYDKGSIVYWDTELDTIQLVCWQDMIDASLILLDKAISIANENSFTIPAEWMGGDTYTNQELSELANSYAARILVYSSRNKTHNEKIDWSKVLNYANKGIQKDLSPELGVRYGFYDMFTCYQRYPGWGRIDHRIINLMDPDYPSRWPNAGVSWTTIDGLDPGPASSVDARLDSDFEYLQNNNFPYYRGYYHFSHYRHKRFDDVFSAVWYGDKPKPSMLVWENELLKAEALLRTGNISGAVSILNDPNGARKVRGMPMEFSSVDASEVLLTIFYERDIELINTGIGIGYFDMRR